VALNVVVGVDVGIGMCVCVCILSQYEHDMNSGVQKCVSLLF
jgi:hypothetical protein